jgi:hypothetical protein
VWGPLDVCSINSTADVRRTTQMYATFLNTLWLIPKRTRHPLDRWTNSTRRMLGLANVRCFFKELVATFPYKYPFPPLILHTHSKLLYAPRLLELRESHILGKIVSLGDILKREAHVFAKPHDKLCFLYIPTLFYLLLYALLRFPEHSLSIPQKC